MNAIIEALMSILAFFTNAWISIVAFIGTLIQEKNYLALAALLVICILIGSAIATIRNKLKITR